MRAIVTGGAGFIGSHVVEALLARGDEVVALDDLSNGKRENVPEGVRLVVADLREPLDKLFDEVRPEVCFHLGAQVDVRVSVERPAHDADVNVIGTISVLEAARRHDTQVVFSSTGGAIYGECDGPADEDAVRRPLAPYGVSKLAGEEYLAAYNRLYGSRHVSLRFGNVYGPRQDPHGEAGVVAIFLGKLAEGEPPRIFGDGSQTRDYVYAGDVAQATLAGAGQDGGVFNVGTGEETSVLDLYELCRRVAGSELEAEEAPPRLGEIQRSVLDVSRAKRDLGWSPEVPLEEGLRRTWESISRVGGGSAAAANRTIRHGARPSDTAWSPPLAHDRGRRRRDRHPRAARARDRRRRADRQARHAPCPFRGSSSTVGEAPGDEDEDPASPPTRLDLGHRPERQRPCPGPQRRRPRACARVGISSARSGTRLGWATDAASSCTGGRRPEALRLARDLGIRLVSPLDGLRPRDLLGAQLAVVVGG